MKPYYKDEYTTIYHGDCTKIMPAIDRVNMILTSPPYNMNLRIRNNTHCSRPIVKEFTTKYNNFSDNLPMDKYLDFNRKVILECLRVSPLVFYNVQFLTGNKAALFKLIGEFAEYLKEIVVWDKINAEPAIGELIMNSQFEVILVFDKENAISRKFINGNFKRGTLSNCWSIKRCRKNEKTHGAVFPVELAEKVITNFSQKGDVILDPFLGTGTTGIACKNQGRYLIGIEKDKRYSEISERRIREIIPLEF